MDRVGEEVNEENKNERETVKRTTRGKKAKIGMLSLIMQEEANYSEYLGLTCLFSCEQ